MQRDTAGVTDSLAASVLVDYSDIEVLSPRGWCIAGSTQQILTGALEVEFMPIQGDIMGVTPGLALNCAGGLAAVLARGQQGTFFTYPAAGR
jgi:hypothetical protein